MIWNLNVSYQLRKRVVFVFCLLLILISCQPKSNPSIISSRAEKLMKSGEFRKLTLLTDSITKGGLLMGKELAKIDSLNEIARRIQIDFSLNEDEIKTRLKHYFPDLDSGMMQRWEIGRKLEMRIIDGEKRYFKQAVNNLFRLDAEAKLAKIKIDGQLIDSLDLFCLEHTQKAIELSKESGNPVLPVKMKLNYTVKVKPNVVPEGKMIRCWMPFPRTGHARQTNIKLLKSEPEQCSIAPESDLQRSVYMEKPAVKDQLTLFNIEFEVESSAQYFDLKPDDIKPYTISDKIYKEFTSERTPQIIFTDEIKRLATRILKGETNPLLQTQKIFKWINDTIPWASALEYGIISNIPEYVLRNAHGDCGMKTLLFMTLVRSQGIPAKWQSGWMLHPGEVNLHDWCEVYFAGVGWVPVDQSFGLQDSADEKVRNFYSSGIDSYRLIVNDDYSRELTPKKKYMRSEPYDFQRGELEWEGGNLYFNQWNWDMEVEYSLP